MRKRNKSHIQYGGNTAAGRGGREEKEGRREKLRERNSRKECGYTRMYTQREREGERERKARVILT